MNNLLVSNFNQIFEWAQEGSLAIFSADLSCCGVEMAQVGGGRFDIERFGCVPQVSPEQADLLIVAGNVSKKMGPEIKLIYDRMSEPKHVIALGNCAISGGMFSDSFSYFTLNGLKEIIPVDVYIPGCPPRPEAILQGLIVLQEQMRSVAKNASVSSAV